MYKKLLLPAGLLSATIIGAGFFALPYLFKQSGIWVGFFYLLSFAIISSVIHLMYAKVITGTEGDHRFVGYSKIYLGKIGSIASFFTMIIGSIFSLVTYLILSISFINLVLPNSHSLLKMLIFWAISTIAIFWNVKLLASVEFLITALIVGIILAVSYFGFGNFLALPDLNTINMGNLFLPYGAVLFSLGGRSAIPSIIEYFKKTNGSKNRVRNAIILGTFVPAIVYALFSIGVIGLSADVSDDAVTGLVGRLPNTFLYAFGLLGIISIWSSYIVIGRNVKESLKLDLKFVPLISNLSIIFIPLALYLLGFRNFIQLVGISGGLFLGIQGVLILLMWKKVIEKENKFSFSKLLLLLFLMIVFIAGAVFSFLII